MKLIVSAAIQSARHLWDVVVFATFSLCVFALVTFQLYKGNLTNKCIKNFPVEKNFTDENWIKFNSNSSNWYTNPDYSYEILLCGNVTGSGVCPPGYTCLQGFGTSPDYGYTNFDSFGWSLLSSYRLMTQDYWESIFRLVLRTAGPLHLPVFFVIIFFGSFYMLSLILAVIFTSYHELHKKAKEEKPDKNNVPKEVSTAANIGGTKETEPNERLLIEQTEKSESFDIKCEDANDPRVTANQTVHEHDSCGSLHKVQNFVGRIVLNPFIELFIILCIILCTLLMAMDHHDMTIDLERFLSAGHRFFVLVFVIEMVLKLIALCPKKFFKDRLNIMDLIVITLAVLNFVLEGISAMSAFLLLRVVRVVRLAWPKMNRLITIMNRTISDLNFLIIMTLLGIFVYSFVGMMLYGKNYVDHMEMFPDGDIPRYNFTDFLHSFIVVFRAFCGEWIESMWDCMLVGDITCVPFFLCISILGNLFVMNLIVAVMLSNFCLSDESDEIAGSEYTKVAEAFKPFSRLSTWIRSRSPDLVKITQPDRTNQTPAEGSFELKDMEREGQQSRNLRSISLCIIESKIFKITMKIIIVLNIVQLALEDVHLIQRRILTNVLYIMECTFTIIFLVEVVIKWLALGLKQYFTNKWCCLDFLIVMVSVITFFEGWFSSSYVIYPIFYNLRALGPLRAISRLKQLRLMADYLVQCLPSILNAIVACLFFWLFFAIIGVQLFAGKFYHCEDDEKTFLDHEIIPDRMKCISENYTWENSEINFDHVGNAYIALFQVATFKGWIQIINDAIDSREINKQPIREVNIYMYYYFVLFIICNSFFLINLLIGVILDNFEKQIKKTGGSIQMLMTDGQRKFYNTIVDISAERPTTLITKPKEKLRATLYDICTSKKLDITITVFIGINMIVMMMDYYGNRSYLLDIFDIIFLILISCTNMLKIFVLKRHFFDEPWNIFDLVLVVLSIAGLLFSNIFMTHYFTLPMLVGLIRVVRVLRLIKDIRGIRTQLYSFARCLPAFFNILLLLFIVMCTYAIFGMFTFRYSHKRAGIDDLFNFRTFGQSMILLFQIITTAGWDGILEGIKTKDCQSFHYIEDCDPETSGILYFVSFLIISYFIIINTFKVIVVENYSKMKEEAKRRNLNENCDGLSEVKLDQLNEETSVLNTQETAGLVLSTTETAHLAPAAAQTS